MDLFATACARATSLTAAAVLAAASLASVAHAAPTVDITTGNTNPIVGGAAYVYTVTVANPDAVAASLLTMSLPLPPSVLFGNLGISGTGAGSFSCSQPPQATNGQVLCRAVSLAAGTSAAIAVTVQAAPDVASGVRTATARLTVGNTEVTDAVQVNLQVNAPLSVSLTGPTTAVAGDRVSYLLSINNSGQSTALNPVLTIVHPVGFGHLAAAGTNSLANACDYNAASRTLSCNPSRLASGFSRLTWTLESSPALAPGPVQFIATVANAGTGTIVVGSASAITTITN